MSVEASKKDPPVKIRKFAIWILVVVFLSYMVAFFDRTNVVVLINDKNFTDAFGITADKAAQGMLLQFSCSLQESVLFFRTCC